MLGISRKGYMYAYGKIEFKKTLIYHKVISDSGLIAQ